MAAAARLQGMCRFHFSCVEKKNAATLIMKIAALEAISLKATETPAEVNSHVHQ